MFFLGANFIEFFKAYNSVDYGLLLEKLNYYGVPGIVNNLLKSYLADKLQTSLEKN